MASKLYFYYGPMGSSKTLRLLSTAYDFEEKGIQIMVLKPSLDTRDGKGIIRSRAGLSRPCLTIDKDVDLYKAIKSYSNALAAQFESLRWVIIDECQFLTEEQVDQLSDVVDFLDINVMCYGRSTDCKSRVCPASKRLFERAGDREEVKATGECGKNKTSINARFDKNGDIIVDGDQIMVGGDESYRAICRKCWKDKVRDKINKEMERKGRNEATD